MSEITKKDLSIFRGKCEEFIHKPAEDMKIYLAWDTQEIYVGNAHGQHVLYGVSKSIINELERKFGIWVGDNVFRITKEEFEKVYGKFFEELSADNKEIIDSAKKELNATINEAMNEFNTIKKDIVDNKNSIDLYRDKFKNIEKKIGDEFNSSESNIGDSIDKRLDELEISFGTLNTFEKRLDNIDEKISEDFNSTESAVGISLDERLTSLEKNNDSIELFRTRLNNIDKKIGGNFNSSETPTNDIIDTRLDSIEGNTDSIDLFRERLNRLDDKIGGGFNSSEDIEGDSSIDSRIDTLENNIILKDTLNEYVKKEELEDIKEEINNSEKYFKFDDGLNIQTHLRDLSDISKFKPVFCTSTSPNGRFLSGYFYYYDKAADEIIPVAAGTIKQVLTKLKIENFGINVNVDENTISKTFKITKIESARSNDTAILGSVFLKYGTSENEKIEVNWDSGTEDAFKRIIYTAQITLSISKYKEYTFSLSANCKEDTEYINYSIEPADEIYYIPETQEPDIPPSEPVLNSYILYNGKLVQEGLFEDLIGNEAQYTFYKETENEIANIEIKIPSNEDIIFTDKYVFELAYGDNNLGHQYQFKTKNQETLNNAIYNVYDLGFTIYFDEDFEKIKIIIKKK